MKIMEAAASKECTEVDNSQFLQGVSETGRIVQVLDSFVHEGPNGDHMCIVLELLGPSVGKVMNLYTWDEDDAPSPGLVVRMAEQVLEGLQFMHHAGMAHGGKCKPRYLQGSILNRRRYKPGQHCVSEYACHKGNYRTNSRDARRALL